MQRRTFLTGLCATGAAALVGAPASAPSTALQALRGEAAPPWWLVAPLTVGTHLGGGWYVRSLSGVRDGVVELTLEGARDEQALVHVCRRAGRPAGLAHTSKLDLFLMNGADGKQVTAEGIGCAVRTAALRIARHEGRTARQLPQGLMSHRARIAAHGPALVDNGVEVSRAC